MCLNPCLEILFQQTLSNLKQDPMALVMFLSLKQLRLNCTLTQVEVCMDSLADRLTLSRGSGCVGYHGRV